MAGFIILLNQMQKLQKLEFSIGLFDKDSKKQEFTEVEAFKIIQKLVVKHFWGGSISAWFGVFQHADGIIVKEPSMFVKTISESSTESFVEDVKTILNQESVMVEVSKVSIEFA